MSDPITIRPAIFDKYCLLERVSVGGMAEVFRAKVFDSPNFHKFLAIKRILPNLAEDDEFIRMFIDEAKIVVRLTHSNICQIYELGKLKDSLFIVMEYIAGRDLLAIQNRTRKEKRIMPVSQTTYIATEIAKGLQYAHTKTNDQGAPLNIIHRDISPQNLLVSYEGEVKLIDFGIAKAAIRSDKTQVGVLKGKFGYMSPEQVQGKEIDARSDIFALGTVFWEMLTGRRLFHADSDFKTLEKVRKGIIPPPSKFNRLIPATLDKIVLKLLHRDREERYSSAQEFVADAYRFLSTVRPPFTARNLNSWMMRTFSKEIEVEREKIKLFNPIKTPEDVRNHNEKLRQEAMARLNEGLISGDNYSQLPQEEEEDVDHEGATVVWNQHSGDQFARLNTPKKSMEVSAPELAPLITAITSIPSAPPQEFVENYQTSQLLDNFMVPPKPPSRVKELAVLLVLLIGFCIVGAVFFVTFDKGNSQQQQITPPQPGSLSIITNPVQSSLEIKINGQIHAYTTPFSMTNVKPGDYIIEIHHRDYQPAIKEVKLGAGQLLTETFNLQRLPIKDAIIHLTVSHEETEIFVDGSPIEGTGFSRTFTVPAQVEHQIKARRKGAKTCFHTIRPESEQELPLQCNLKSEKGKISVNSKPRGVVYFNNKKIGRTPQVFDNLDSALTYQVEIRKKGYNTRKETISFDDVFEKNLSYKLKRIGQ